METKDKVTNNRIRILRDKAHLTQMKLSELSGVSRTTISNLENGSLTNVSVNTLKKICAAFGQVGVDIDLATLFEGTEG